MPKKKRYLIGSRYSPQLNPGTLQELEAFVADKEEAEIVKRTPIGRLAVEMMEGEMRELASKNPHLIIEEDQVLKLFPMPGLPEVTFAGENYSRTVVVKDTTNGKAIPNATIYGIGVGPAYKAVTDAEGAATLFTNEATLIRAIASPCDTYWSRVIEDISMIETDALEISLKPLLVTGAYAWGHRLMNFRQVNRCWRGRGIKVGIIDSGISDKLEDLKPASGYNTLDGATPTEWNVDEKGHGTHCAGIIAALSNAVGVHGGAPDAEVYSLKVFPGGYVSDLVEAVEWCISNRIDIINLSLGSQQPSRVLAGVIYDAYDRGITCIAAAGNDRTRVAHLASLPTTIAVSAIGRFGTFPEDSAHTLKIGTEVDWRGQLFAANFNNFGPELDVCAPGVAILSTVPTGYVSWDGTSFACPLIAALAALILEAYPMIRTGDARQPEFVRSILHNAAINLGLPPLVQGRGLPLAASALAAASTYASSYYSMTAPYSAYPF